jgi:hypothetical protein
MALAILSSVCTAHFFILPYTGVFVNVFLKYFRQITEDMDMKTISALRQAQVQFFREITFLAVGAFQPTAFFILIVFSLTHY